MATMETAVMHRKLTKPKGKMVKPILKKLSHSERTSLDLDRPWEEQQGPGLGVMGPGYDFGPPRSARDVSFTFDGPAGPVKPRFQHGRTASGTSHVSVATTASGSGQRAATFVHSFQPTPRTQTPPLSFANSTTSLGDGLPADGSVRDYSPTITEDDNDCPGSLPRSQRLHNRATSASQLRRPSLGAQRTASFGDMSTAPPLRVNTIRSVPSGHLRRGHGSSGLASPLSHSDLQLQSTTTLDSPSSASVGPSMTSPISAAASVHTVTGSSANASTPLSPFRSSLEGVGFPRLRSRSELSAGDRTEQIREARRKFEERERAKAEKHDRELVRKRERKDHKEAKEMERQSAAQSRKNSGNGSGGDTARPSLSRKTTPTFVTGASGGETVQRPDEAQKPLAFKSSNYDNMTGGARPSFGHTVGDVAFANAQRNKSTKRKTQGYWNEFILWLRTRLFRLGRK